MQKGISKLGIAPLAFALLCVAACGGEDGKRADAAAVDESAGDEETAPEDRIATLIEANGASELVKNRAATLTLPLPGEQRDETHNRHAWRMPQEHESAIAVIRWKDASFEDLRVDLGVGVCPHRGETLATGESSSGGVVVHYQAEERAPPRSSSWFVHVNADANADEKAGESLDYVYSIYTY
ncbi:MAG: hypothetical protein R6V85_08680 [Polyangia bacterium]